MEQNNFQTPILLIIFNSARTTEAVWNEIQKIRPGFLYIAADGPRNEADRKKCKEARNITEKIDWPCEVKRKYSESNLGCKMGPVSAINWFFDNVDEGIILEDDCLPNPSFFGFCQELLSHYRNNEKVKMICGSNFLFGKVKLPGSYYFSNFPQVWGWATWKRAWRENDPDMPTYPDFKATNKIAKIFKEKRVQNYWTRLFDRLYKDKPSDVWDGQWAYSIFSHDGVSVIPSKNLISNIGYGPDATHTVRPDMFSDIKTESVGHIVHSNEIRVDEEADQYYASLIIKNIWIRIGNKIIRCARSLKA